MLDHTHKVFEGLDQKIKNGIAAAMSWVPTRYLVIMLTLTTI